VTVHRNKFLYNKTN